MSVEKIDWLQRVAEDGLVLGDAPEILKSDREVVLTAVKEYGRALQHASEPLKGDRDLVLKAVAQCGWALQHAAEPLKSDKEVVLTAVAQNGDALKYAADALLEDESFAKGARKEFYFFKVTTALSGRSCILAKFFVIGSARDLVEESCRKLGLQSTGREKLLFGDAVVPEGNLSEKSPGCPGSGKLVEYQLIL